MVALLNFAKGLLADHSWLFRQIQGNGKVDGTRSIKHKLLATGPLPGAVKANFCSKGCRAGRRFDFVRLTLKHAGVHNFLTSVCNQIKNFPFGVALSMCHLLMCLKLDLVAQTMSDSCHGCCG